MFSVRALKDAIPNLRPAIMLRNAKLECSDAALKKLVDSNLFS